MHTGSPGKNQQTPKRLVLFNSLPTVQPARFKTVALEDLTVPQNHVPPDEYPFVFQG